MMDKAILFSLTRGGSMLQFSRRAFIAAVGGSIAAVTLSGCSDESANQRPTELFAWAQHEKDSPEWVSSLSQAQDKSIKQLFVVAGMGKQLTTATISMHERDENEAWRQVLSTPGYVGRDGLCPDSEHEEGDFAKTPIGVYKFNKAFGIADDPGCAMEYTKIDDDAYWSGDMREGMHYNELVSIKELPDLNTEDSEHIIEYDFQYQYCLNISFNEEGTPGRGSAIFLHCLDPAKPYTGGCVAIPEYAMIEVVKRVSPNCVVVIDTLDNMNGSF